MGWNHGNYFVEIDGVGSMRGQHSRRTLDISEIVVSRGGNVGRGRCPPQLRSRSAILPVRESPLRNALEDHLSALLSCCPGERHPQSKWSLPRGL